MGSVWLLVVAGLLLEFAACGDTTVFGRNIVAHPGSHAAGPNLAFLPSLPCPWLLRGRERQEARACDAERRAFVGDLGRCGEGGRHRHVLGGLGGSGGGGDDVTRRGHSEVLLGDSESLLRQAEEALGRGKRQLGAATPDKRSIEESVEELQETVRELVRARARLLSEPEGMERHKDVLVKVGGVIKRCDDTSDELRRMAYNAPSPWQNPFSAPPPRKSRAEGQEKQTNSVGKERGRARSPGPVDANTEKDENGSWQRSPSPPSWPERSESSEEEEKVLLRPGNMGGIGGRGVQESSSSTGVDEVIGRAEVVVKGGRRLMGLLDPNKAQRAQMEDALEELAAIISEMNSQHKDNARVAVAKASAETTEEQLRQLLYSLPSLPPQLPSFSLPSLIKKPDRNPPKPSNRQGTVVLTRSLSPQGRPRSSPASSKNERVRIPRKLGSVRSLEVLLSLLDQVLEETKVGAKLSGGDAAVAANSLKRLKRQARGGRQSAAVEETMIELAKCVLASSESLEPRHVALTLNALADSAARGGGGRELEVGRTIPRKWKSGDEYTKSERNEFESGEFVVVERSDGSMRFGCIDKLASTSGATSKEYLVRVSRGLGDAALFRTEGDSTLGKLMVPWAQRLILRRNLCFKLGTLYVDNRSLLQRSSARDLAAAMWAHAKVGAVNEALFLMAGNHVRKGGLLPEASAQDMATILWAHADLAWPNKRLFQAVGQQMIEGGFVETCNQQDVSLVLWSFAKMKLWHPQLCETLAARVANVGLSNAQAASNALWAMAELGVGDHEASVLAVCDLIRQDQLGAVTPQGASNMLWALAVLEEQDSEACNVLLSSLMHKSDMVDVLDKCQLHQFFLTRSLLGKEVEGRDKDSALSIETEADGEDQDSALEMLKAECADAFISTSSSFQRPSSMQTKVKDIVTRLELEGEVLSEHVLPGIGYSVDLFLPSLNIAIEVDGPNHFLASTEPNTQASRHLRMTGSSLLKARLLRAWGVKLVSIAFDDYDKMMLKDPQEMLDWMRSRLDGAA